MPSIPFSQGTLFNFRMRLITHNLDKTLLDRTVALAEHTGGFGARQLRAVLDSTPLFGAGRVEDTLNLLGHALRKAVGLAAQALDVRGGTCGGRRADAGGTQQSQSGTGPGLGGQRTLPRAGLGPGGGGTVATLAGAAAHPGGSDTSSAGGHGDHHAAYHAGHRARPGGGPGGRRIKQHVAPDRRISIEDQDMRHGRKSSAKTFNGFKEHFAVDLDSTVTREVVVRPANEPEHEAVELLAEELEKAPGLQLDIDLGYMASPRIAQGAEQGVYIIARPWPQVGPLFTKHDFTLDFAGMQVTCPGGQTVPMVPGKQVQFPAVACDACALRAQCTKAAHGQGEAWASARTSSSSRSCEPNEDTRGRASLRKRTAVSTRCALRTNWCTARTSLMAVACGGQQRLAARYEGASVPEVPPLIMRRSATSREVASTFMREEHRLAFLRYHRIDQCSIDLKKKIF